VNARRVLTEKEKQKIKVYVYLIISQDPSLHNPLNF